MREQRCIGDGLASVRRLWRTVMAQLGAAARITAPHRWSLLAAQEPPQSQLAIDAHDQVLLSNDLLPLILASLHPVEDGAAAAVCSQWARSWEAKQSRARAVIIDFLRSARLGCMFARHIIYGCEYGAGHIYWIDSTQPDAPAVPFTHASLHGFKVIQGPDATDLASRLVQIYRGEVEGIEAHPHYHLGVVKYHRAVCRPYCLEVIRGWLLDTAQHDGTPRPTAGLPTHLTLGPTATLARAEQASACSTVSGWRSSSTASACSTAATCWHVMLTRSRRLLPPITKRAEPAARRLMRGRGRARGRGRRGRRECMPTWTPTWTSTWMAT